MLTRLIALQKKKWWQPEVSKVSVSPKYQYKPLLKMTLREQSLLWGRFCPVSRAVWGFACKLLPTCACPLLCDNMCWIDEMAQNSMFSATLWWFRFGPSIDTCFSNRQSSEIWTVSVLCSLLEFCFLFPSRITALYSWCIWQQDNIAVGGEVTPIIYTSLQVPYLMFFMEFIVQEAEAKKNKITVSS